MAELPVKKVMVSAPLSHPHPVRRLWQIRAKAALIELSHRRPLKLVALIQEGHAER